MKPSPSAVESWPALPCEEWKETANTPHMWMQVVGKTRLALTPRESLVECASVRDSARPVYLVNLLSRRCLRYRVRFHRSLSTRSSKFRVQQVHGAR
jgi:hypothetical protein